MRTREAGKSEKVSTIAAVAAVVAAACVGLPHPAGAAGVDGAIAVKSVGFNYAGQQSRSALVSRTVTPGQTAAFSIKVINTGSVATSYSLKNVFNTDDFYYKVLSGYTDVTSAEQSSTGYVTPAIAPGKNKVFTVKVLTSTAATPGDEYILAIGLFGANGSGSYGASEVLTNITRTKGISRNDVYLSTSGQKTTCVCNGVFLVGSSATVTALKKSSFNLKLANDSGTDTSYTVNLYDQAANDCNNFATDLKRGTTNILDQAESNDGYSTGTVAAHASITLTLTLQNTAPWPTDCYQGNWMSAEVDVSDGQGITNAVYAVTNVV